MKSTLSKYAHLDGCSTHVVSGWVGPDRVSARQMKGVGRIEARYWLLVNHFGMRARDGDPLSLKIICLSGNTSHQQVGTMVNIKLRYATSLMYTFC